MRLPPVFSGISPAGQLLLLILLVLVGAIFSIILAIGVSYILWGSEILSMATSTDGKNLDFIRTFQIINQIGIFVLPPLLFGALVTKSANVFLNLKKPGFLHVIAAIAIIIAVAPVINFLVQWNEGLSLPASFKAIENWMRNSEETATRLTEQFLNASKPQDLFVNLLMIGILPALGEELLFRSALIGILRKMFKSVHWPVIISALIFSAFHLQFFGFVPRFVLGILLGYLLVWSGSVWVPIMAHFVNNSTIVVVSWLYENKFINTGLEDFENFGSWTALLLSLLVSGAILLWVYRTRASGLKPENSTSVI
ncbi:MAG: CPBP family intramembrane metalloprotease [Lentimicrobium sp.]|nr:CPBP family intramembrane metalloprotease [Lentimicrobium sp.]